MTSSEETLLSVSEYQNRATTAMRMAANVIGTLDEAITGFLLDIVKKNMCLIGIRGKMHWLKVTQLHSVASASRELGLFFTENDRISYRSPYTHLYSETDHVLR
jgi:hypothetical protein